MIDRMMTTTRNSVPQRGWAVGYLRISRDDERVAVLEGVDRHVLGAVVLEDAPDVRGLRDQEQVAEEDRDADQALDEVLDEAVLDVRGRDARDEQRQQEEDADAEQEREREHERDRALAELDARRRRPGGWRCGRASGCRRTASRTGRRGRGRTAASTSACRGRRCRGARWRRRSGRRDGGGRPRSRRGRASGRLRSGPDRRTSSEALRKSTGRCRTAPGPMVLAAIWRLSPLNDVWSASRRRPPSSRCRLESQPPPARRTPRRARSR